MQNTQKSEIDSKYHFYVCHLSRTELLEINPWLEVIQNIWRFWTFFVKIIIFLWKSWRNFTESCSMQRIKSSLIVNTDPERSFCLQESGTDSLKKNFNIFLLVMAMEEVVVVVRVVLFEVVVMMVITSMWILVKKKRKKRKSLKKTTEFTCKKKEMDYKKKITEQWQIRTLSSVAKTKLTTGNKGVFIKSSQLCPL